MSAPTITTERLTLKPMCSDYLASTHEYASDRETCKFMLFLPNDTLADTLGYLHDAEAEAAKQEEENAEPEIELIDVLPSASEGYGFAETTAAPEATLPPATK